MTLSSAANASPPLQGNGLSNTWTTTVKMLSAAEVALYVRSGAGGETIIPAVDYAVALVDEGRGGCVVTYPLDNRRVLPGEFVLIRRNPDYLQPVGLTNQGAFNPEVVERALDRVTTQTQDLLDRQSKTIRVGLSQRFNQVVPIDGQPLKWQLNPDGSWSLASGDIEGITPPAQRVLYAQDLGLAGDGTDESGAMTVALAAASVGGGCVAYLKAPAGYWYLDGPVYIPDGAQVQFGSPIRRGRNGSIVMGGYHALELTSVTISAITNFGATVLPVQGAAPSAAFAVGDWIDFGSERNRIVTGLDDDASTVTIGVATDFNLLAGAAISRIVSSALTVDLAMESRAQAIPVANPGLFPIGAIVMLLDDETSGGAILNSEQAVVVGSTSTTVLIDRAVRHPFAMANNARLHLLRSRRNASVSGIAVENAQAPTDVQVDIVVMRYAYRCKVQAAAFPNSDDYGARGQCISRYRSLECDVEDVWVGTPKYLGAEEGYACTLEESTGCKTLKVDAVGVNGAISYAACTDCWDDLSSARLWQSEFIRWAGRREIGCWSYDVNGSAGTVDNQAGLRFGTAAYAAGCIDCGAAGGEIVGVNGTYASGIAILAVADKVSVKGILFRGGDTGVYSKNRADGSGLEIGEVSIACEFHDFNYPVYIDMDLEGGTGRPFNVLDLSGSRFINWLHGLHFDNLDKVVLEDFALRTTRAAAEHALDFQNVTAATVSRGSFDGAYAIARIQNTPLDINRYDVRNPGSSTILTEVGSGSAGWRDAYGFYPLDFTPDRSTTSDGVIYSLPGME